MPAITPARRPHPTTVGRERSLTLDRFGGRAELRVQPDAGCTARAQARLDQAAALLSQVDRTLSRFDSASELSRLNRDPRRLVPASPLMLRFVEAVGWAGRHSGGLVDATCLPDVERAGYRQHLDLPDAASEALPGVGGARCEAAPPQLAPQPSEDADPVLTEAWRSVYAGLRHVERPVGVRLDSGGIGKGLAADLAAELLQGAPAWMVDCGGDLRIGGTARLTRAVDVRDPVDGSKVIHRLHVTRGAVATSGITRRSWHQDGAPSHHLIDPRTGQPAATGVVQVTALAPTGLAAEVIAKTALLQGVEHAHHALPHGGVVVTIHGGVTVVPPPRIEQARRGHEDRAAFHVPGRSPASRSLRRG